MLQFVHIYYQGGAVSGLNLSQAHWKALIFTFKVEIRIFNIYSGQISPYVFSDLLAELVPSYSSSKNPIKSALVLMYF
ncbi:hypothetical protein RIR_jg11486.t1 [Rhizophagus irregularis DAOM 181602=DAOM 197198]|nr:hypothetical protein RIR_jg11486.t1 [Rhizophagus irregularis DAOM 181602=DAOM 197198]